jgi:hypothetical protein
MTKKDLYNKLDDKAQEELKINVESYIWQLCTMRINPQCV